MNQVESIQYLRYLYCTLSLKNVKIIIILPEFLQMRCCVCVSLSEIHGFEQGEIPTSLPTPTSKPNQKQSATNCSGHGTIECTHQPQQVLLSTMAPSTPTPLRRRPQVGSQSSPIAFSHNAASSFRSSVRREPSPPPTSPHPAERRATIIVVIHASS